MRITLPFACFHAQYDWTTGVPDNGNEWRKFRAVPRMHPLRPLFCTLFKKSGNRRAFRLPGAGGRSFPVYGGTFARSYSVSTVIIGTEFGKGDATKQRSVKRSASSLNEGQAVSE